MPILAEFAGADAQAVITCTLLSGIAMTAVRPLDALRREEPTAAVMARRGNACRDANQEVAAAAWYARILAAPIPEDVDPYDDALRFLVTATRVELQDLPRAVALADALVAHTCGRDARTWYTLALAHQRLGHRAEAERACLAALALRPGHQTVLATLSTIRAMAE